jgi:hypothetical protein
MSVKGLDRSVTPAGLRGLFRQFESVLSVYPCCVPEVINRGALTAEFYGQVNEFARQVRNCVAEAGHVAIPIVFVNVGNPIGIGLVKSLPRPGGTRSDASPRRAATHRAPSASLLGVACQSTRFLHIAPSRFGARSMVTQTAPKVSNLSMILFSWERQDSALAALPLAQVAEVCHHLEDIEAVTVTLFARTRPGFLSSATRSKATRSPSLGREVECREVECDPVSTSESPRRWTDGNSSHSGQCLGCVSACSGCRGLSPPRRIEAVTVTLFARTRPGFLSSATRSKADSIAVSQQGGRVRSVTKGQAPRARA